MQLPPIHNKRFLAQWQVIEERIVTGRNKTAIDLGCGYGDLAAKLKSVGLDVWAIEGDQAIIKKLHKRLPQSVELHTANLNDFNLTKKFDYGFCFSVLPYLEHPIELLHWMCEHVGKSFIECQYYGDDPGLETIKDDNDMQYFLWKAGFKWAQLLGKTHVKDRIVSRSIWLVQTNIP